MRSIYYCYAPIEPRCQPFHRSHFLFFVFFSFLLQINIFPITLKKKKKKNSISLLRFPNFSTFHLLFHQTQFDNNSNFLNSMTLTLPNQAVIKTIQLPLYQNSKKKKKNTDFLSIYICDCSTSLLQIWKVPLK